MAERQVCLITGANTGIGRVTARTLARGGMHVVLACRSETRAKPVIEDIKAEAGPDAVSFLPLDLADLTSVRQCAQSFLARDRPLHLLINNAGVAGKKGLTSSGFEMAFGINHVGHFLLTALLQERVLQSAPARIVIVASQAHRRSPGLNFDAVRRPTQTFSGIPEYGTSKLANILHAAELGRRLAGTGVHTYSLHPGVVATDLWRNIPLPLRWPMIKLRRMLTPEQGAQTLLYCARSEAVVNDSGLYYRDRQVAEPTALAQDRALAEELFLCSQRWVGLT